MARKKIRKGVGRKKELQQPDEVMSALQGTYSTIDRYKYWIIGAIAASLLVVLGVSAYVSWSASARQADTEAFFKVFEIHLAEVVAPPETGDEEDGEEPADEPEEGTYPSEETKNQALAAAVEGFIDEHGGGAIEDAARLLLVSAYTRLGKNEEAVAELEAFLKDEGDSSTLKPLVLENLGALKLRIGDAAGAAARFEEMQKATAVPYFQALALIHLGDLANPTLRLAAGDKDAGAARVFYEKALELLPDEPDEGLMPSLASMARHDVQVRLLLTPES